MSILEAKHVTYVYQSKYQKVQALTDVTCDFEVGKFYAIVGHSGSGKTTLLSLLCGVVGTAAALALLLRFDAMALLAKVD